MKTRHREALKEFATLETNALRRYCQCESSHCDHPAASCSRRVSGFVWMQYVGDTCDTCAANMCVSGGAEYISLRD